MDKSKVAHPPGMHILDKLPAVIFEYTVFPDGNRNFTYLSPRCQEVLGLNREDLLRGAFPMKHFIYPRDGEAFLQSLGNSLATLNDWKWEGCIQHHDEIKWIEGVGVPTRMDDGRVAWSGIITDSTQRKELERHQRKEAEENIRKAETLFSQLFQNSPMAIVMLNDRGTVVKVNKGFEEMFGYSPEELSGRELNQFIVPEGLESEGNDLNTLITSYRVMRIETNRIRKDGKHLSVIIYGVPVHLNETTIGIFGVYVDITERKKVEEELKIRNTELDNFVYKVSHDLRAPLSSILGLVNLANLPGNDDNLKDYLPLVGQKVLQLDHFISDVLSHSKNLKLDVRTDFVDLRKIIRQTFTELNYLKGNDEIRKEVCVEGEDFYSDPWRIAEIFRNLISNAIPLIEIETYSTKEATEISFKDNGIGIDEENLEHIFEMFYRASEQSEGSGLGLYIVKNAVDKLGGVVMVNSQLGQGTSFKIVIPNQGQKKLISAGEV